MIQDSFYHSVLRILSLTFALILVFESGLLSPTTKELSLDTHQFLAGAIGINASVVPDELNMLTAELTAQKQQLEKREATLAKREIAVGLNTGQAGNNSTSIFILSAILFILLVLILLNYALDYMRRAQTNRPITT